ncbi:hypothetical protein KKC13_10490 [bacterium]|nr:hypothetical protein [bacterium]MBU1956869.1 hypothetical protein [bacterium]
MKKIVLTLFVALLFTACETGVRYDQNSTNTTVAHDNGIVDLIDEKPSFEDEGFDTDLHPIVLEKESLSVADATVQTFEGGVIGDGLNVKSIREGNHDSYMRLVFDTYMWSDGSSKPANNVGHYKVNYYPSKKVITVVISGYRAFSAAFPKFSSVSIVEKIYFDKYLDDSGYTFHIKLRDAAKVRVFDLKSPARLVFDIKKL